MDAEQQFLDAVRALHAIGYGRMQQIISHEWYRHDPTGALLATTCYGLLPSAERAAYAALASADPLFKRDDPSFLCESCGRETHVRWNGMCENCAYRGDR